MKIDLHIHTNFSWDGFSSPKEVVDLAIQKGIDKTPLSPNHHQKRA